MAKTRLLLDTCAVIDLITSLRETEQMLTSIEQDYGIEFLPLRRDTAHTYASLTLNEAQDHRDPSDHVIIAHAITEHLTLLSSDQKFAFYRSQGLNLIEY